MTVMRRTCMWRTSVNFWIASSLTLMVSCVEVRASKNTVCGSYIPGKSFSIFPAVSTLGLLLCLLFLTCFSLVCLFCLLKREPDLNALVAQCGCIPCCDLRYKDYLPHTVSAIFHAMEFNGYSTPNPTAWNAKVVISFSLQSSLHHTMLNTLNLILCLKS